MELTESPIAAVGRLALGAAFASPEFARIGARPKGSPAATGDDSDRKIAIRPLPFRVAIYGAIVAGWIGERRTLLSRDLDKDARAMVSLKDILVAGAVLTGAANLAGEEVVRRRLPDGVPVTADHRLSPNAPKQADHYRRYFKAMGALNRIFIAGAIAATPFINFALFNDYRPRPIRSFFAL